MTATDEGRPGRPRTCSRCGLPLRPISASPADATVGTVAALAVGPVGSACPGAAGHDRLVPSAADRRRAMTDSFDVADRTALRGRLRCGVCRTPFALPGRRTNRTVTIVNDGPAVTVTFDVPVLRCTEDAVDNLPPPAFDDALTALDQLLGSPS